MRRSDERLDDELRELFALTTTTPPGPVVADLTGGGVRRRAH